MTISERTSRVPAQDMFSEARPSGRTGQNPRHGRCCRPLVVRSRTLSTPLTSWPFDPWLPRCGTDEDLRTDRHRAAERAAHRGRARSSGGVSRPGLHPDARPQERGAAHRARRVRGPGAAERARLPGAPAPVAQAARGAAGGRARGVGRGVSFPAGRGVEAAASWPRLLEAVLAARHPGRYQVVNLGVPGTNPRDHLSHLRNPGLAYEPDVVLVTVMGNDVQERWVQRELGVQFASGLLVDVRRAMRDPPPAWTRLPRVVFPALYPYVWNRLYRR